MAPKRDDFLEGLRGSGWNKYSPGYRTGELWRKALTFNPPPSASASRPQAYAPAPVRSAPQRASAPRNVAYTNYSAGSALPHTGSSGSALKKFSIFTAIIGALLFAAAASSSVSGAPLLVVAAIGAFGGWLVPFFLVLVGKLIVFLARLMIGLLAIAFGLAVIAGVIYFIAIVASR